MFLLAAVNNRTTESLMQLVKFKKEGRGVDDNFNSHVFFSWSPRCSEAFGEKIIFPLSSSVIPSVNSSAGISLPSHAR